MYLIYYYLISISILGYGFLINKSFNINSKNLGIIGFFGIFFLILVSYLSTLFFAHDYFFNLVILITGLSLAIYFLRNFQAFKVDLLYFFIVYSYYLYSSSWKIMMISILSFLHTSLTKIAILD